MPFGSANGVYSYQIAEKDRGTRQTLAVMAQLVNQSLLDPYVREFTKEAVKFANPRDNLELAQTIDGYLRDHFEFFRDPSGIELIHTPHYMVQEIEKHGNFTANINGYFRADCDDFSILAASMAKASGMPAVFVVYAFPQTDNEYAHVFTMSKVNDQWYPYDRNVQYPPSGVKPSRQEVYPI